MHFFGIRLPPVATAVIGLGLLVAGIAVDRQPLMIAGGIVVVVGAVQFVLGAR